MRDASNLAATADLQSMFERFNQASQALESRYNNLLQETERLRQELDQKTLELKQQERLATLGEMAAAIAHEVRNPLGSIKLFVSLLFQDLTNNPSATELLQQIDISLGRLDGVIGNILHFAKDSVPNHAPVNIHSLIQEQWSQASALNASAVEANFDLAADPFVQGCEGSLRQVLANIFNNALQACNGSGQVSIKTCNTADGLAIKVQDSGPGIPEALLDKIFDPFVTSKSEGTGLGLAIVRRIVEQHGGTICVLNQTQGAEFVISLSRKLKRADLK